MSLTKEECENSLINLCSSNSKVEDRKVFKQLIHEHFELIENFKQLEKNYDGLYDEIHNSKPLKFEELKEGMWVWDNEQKKYLKIVDVIDWDEDDNEPAFLIVFEPNEYDCWVENRFYRYQVD